MPIAAQEAVAAGAETGSQDRRVLELAQLVDSGQFDVLSLDVFDTLVWRMVPEPADVFFLVAERLRALDVVYPSSTAESFVRERIEAEDRARRRQASLEVTLAEIYAEFPAGYLRGIAPGDLPAIEFGVERDIVRINADMAALVRRARARGMQVALVSDTYFSSDQVRALTAIEVDHVLTSCEHRRAKRHGLHEVLIDRTRANPERVLHVGDNFHADVAGPGGLGFARYWFRRFPDAYGQLLAMELPAPFSRRAAYVESADQGLASLRGRAMFQCDTEHERWGAGVFGPVVAGFGDWVAARCRDTGVRTALCLMREGRVLREVLACADPALDAREVYVSRFVALQAAILEGSEDELLRFAARPSPPRLGTLLEQLGLPADAISDDPGQRLGHDAVKRLVRHLARDRRLRATVVESSAAVRARLMRHFDSQGALGGTVAIVDLGYNGTIQECLQRIFAHERPGLATHGFYLVTAGGVHRAQAAGCAVEGWLAENGQPVGMAHTFVRSPEIAEQSLMADCGSTVGYEDDGTPVLDFPRVSDAQRAEITQTQAGIARFARLWAEHRTRHGAPAPAVARRLAQATAVRMVSRPLAIELELFAHWQHDENFGSTSTRTLTTVVELDPWEASHLSAHQLASLGHDRVYWPFGHAAQISDTMRDAVAAIYQRLAEPRVFDSAHAVRPVGFFWDIGGGFDPRLSRVEPVLLNNRGRAWQRFRLGLERQDLRSAAVAIGAVGEIVALTGVRLHLRAKNGAIETRRFEHEDLEKVGYAALHERLYRVAQEPALLVVPIELTAFTGVVDVDVFFSVLEAA